MKLAEYIRLALNEIFHNKARTFLTLIGIIIGITAVIVIIFMVQGAERYVMGEITKIAPVDLMQVRGRYNPETRRILGQITMEDIKYIEEKEGDKIKALAPRYYYTGTLEYKGKENDCDLIPTTPAFQQVYGLKVARGRFLSQLDLDNFNQVIVLGYETAADLFGESDPINKKITLFGMTFVVIGVLPPDYQSPIVPVSINDTRGFIPITVLERLAGYENRFTLLIRTKGREYLPYMMTRVTELLDSRHGLAENGQSRFQAYDMTNGLDMVNIIKIVLMVLLAGVASITLLVAGIGVMNIMLVIVTERTREIGLRKAIGANRRDIMLQFIIESIILCLFGGLGGIIGGYLGSDLVLKIANSFINLEAEVPSWATLVSILFTSGVGLFFGIYPALKAARMDPIKALHYE